MADVIHATNFGRANILEVSELLEDALADQAVIKVVNPDGYVVNSYIVVGERGTEKAELKQIQSITSNTITLTSNLERKHVKGEKVTRVYGNQIKIYRAANVDGNVPADGDFSLLSTVSIEADQLHTRYSDSTGGSSYWYKQTYYNSTSTNETPLADTSAVRGGGYGNYADIEDVIDESGMKDNKNLAEIKVAMRRDEAQSEVKGALRAAGYTMPLQTSTGTLYTPPLVRNITRILAAGYLLSQDFGTVAPAAKKEGKAKLELANNMLTAIAEGKKLLLDDNGNQLAKTDQVNGYPDDSTSEEDPDTGEIVKGFLFEVGKKF